MQNTKDGKYKGLVVPVFRDGKSYKDWKLDDWEVCLSGSSGITNHCPPVPACKNCILHTTNVNTAIEYLVEYGYITEAQALQYILDNQ